MFRKFLRLAASSHNYKSVHCTATQKGSSKTLSFIRVLWILQADLVEKFRLEVLQLPSMYQTAGYAHLLDYNKVWPSTDLYAQK